MTQEYLTLWFTLVTGILIGGSIFGMILGYMEKEIFTFWGSLFCFLISIYLLVQILK